MTAHNSDLIAATSRDLPGWLRHRPEYHLAAWLWWRAAPRIRWWALAAAAASAAPALLLARSGLPATAALHPQAVLSLALIVFLSMGIRRRQALERTGTHTWTAALPSSVSRRERVALVPLGLGAGLAWLTFLGGLMDGLGWRALGCAASVLGGAGAGVLLALLAPAGWVRATDPPASPVWLNRPLAGTRPSLMPLGHWPVARQQGWARPKVLAYGSFLLLMGIPMTQSGGGFGRVAVGTVAGWFVGHHLVSLLLALLRTAFAAAHWLSGTPLTTSRFAFWLGHRVWTKEALASFLLVCAITALDARLTGVSALLATAWVLAGILLGVAACGIAQRPGGLTVLLQRRLR